jgi:hypothetical protein
MIERPEWARAIRGWPDNHRPAVGTFDLLRHERDGSWTHVLYQHVNVEGDRAIRKYTKARLGLGPAAASRVILLELGEKGHWTIFSTNPRFWTPFWFIHFERSKNNGASRSQGEGTDG